VDTADVVVPLVPVAVVNIKAEVEEVPLVPAVVVPVLLVSVAVV
jgi:hypothetical protein